MSCRVLPFGFEEPHPRPALQSVSVGFEYPVVFTRGVFDVPNGSLARVISRKEPHRRHRSLVVLDSGVADAWPTLAASIRAYFDHHRDRLDLVTNPIVAAGGEEAKNDPEVLRAFLRMIHDRRLDRHSTIVVVGGGALLDMVGYAAATAHRGIRVVRLPTTTLAQGDSGIGVKNGVNAFGKKNFLGTFAPPFGVICDERFLETLSPRDRIAGTAEAVKVALVRDASLFHWMRDRATALRRGDLRVLVEAAKRCAELHLRHIVTSGDPFEMGSARPLDFGHWAAHKLESMTDHRLRHGEAVAIGIAIDALYSAASGICSFVDAEAALGLLRSLGFRLWDEALSDRRILDGLAEFREHLGGELTVTMLRKIGEGHDVHMISEPVVLQCIRELERSERP